MKRRLCDKSTFGKYSGQTWAWVLANNPKYIEWAYFKIEGFKIEGLTWSDIREFVPHPSDEYRDDPADVIEDDGDPPGWFHSGMFGD